MSALRFAIVILLAGAPARWASAESRISDIRVGHHAGYDRIVVELDAEAAVRWEREGGEDVFEIEARPLLRRQIFATGQPRLGQMTLSAEQAGARLRLESRPRRTRAFLLADPPRLVIDVSDPGTESFELPPGVRGLEPEIGAMQSTVPPEAPIEEAPIVTEAPAPPGAGDPGAGLEPDASLEDAVEDVAAARSAALPPSPPRSALRPILVPLLAGAALLLLAAGGISLAGAQRWPRRRAVLADLAGPAGLDLAAVPLAGDRLELLEKRIDEEVRARMQLEEQLAQAREEVAGLQELLARPRRAPSVS